MHKRRRVTKDDKDVSDWRQEVVLTDAAFADQEEEQKEEKKEETFPEGVTAFYPFQLEQAIPHTLVLRLLIASRGVIWTHWTTLCMQSAVWTEKKIEMDKNRSEDHKGPDEMDVDYEDGTILAMVEFATRGLLPAMDNDDLLDVIRLAHEKKMNRLGQAALHELDLNSTSAGDLCVVTDASKLAVLIDCKSLKQHADRYLNNHDLVWARSGLGIISKTCEVQARLFWQRLTAAWKDQAQQLVLDLFVRKMRRPEPAAFWAQCAYRQLAPLGTVTDVFDFFKGVKWEAEEMKVLATAFEAREPPPALAAAAAEQEEESDEESDGAEQE